MIICLSQELSEQSIECASGTPTHHLWKLLAALFSARRGNFLRRDTTKHKHTHVRAHTQACSKALK